MNHTTPRQAIVVWMLLVAATMCSGWLAEHHGLAGHWTGAAVMLVAAVKGRAVILHFMEIKGAPQAWRIAFELWIWLCPALIVIFWMISEGLVRTEL